MEKQTQDLSAAIKAKVDLQKELSKVSREAEKSKHAQQILINRLEREIEQSNNEIIKLQTDIKSKDAEKIKLLDENDRKMKAQDNNVLKLRSKIKDLEKELKLAYTTRTSDHLKDSEKASPHNLQNLKRKLKEEQDKYASLEARAIHEMDSLKSQINNEQAKYRMLLDEMKKIESQIAVDDAANGEMRNLIQNLQNQIAELKSVQPVVVDSYESSFDKDRYQQLLQEFQEDEFIYQIIAKIV